MKMPLIVSADPFTSNTQGETACVAEEIRKEQSMKRVINYIAVAALAVTTMGAGTTQAQAGSDLRRALVGAVAIGLVANQVKKSKSRRQTLSSRSFDRGHQQPAARYNDRRVRQGQHGSFERSKRLRHARGY